MVHQRGEERILLLGGRWAAPSGEKLPLRDLWAWDASGWKRLDGWGEGAGPEPGSGLTVDERGRLFTFGGPSQALWSWSAGRGWKKEGGATPSPPSRQAPGVAWTAQGLLVLGGHPARAEPYPLDHAWLWRRDPPRWERLEARGPAPPPRRYLALSWSLNAPKGYLFGGKGQSAPGATPKETPRFGDLWRLRLVPSQAAGSAR